MSSYGQLDVRSTIATYSAASAFTTPAAATTDMFEIYGSSTKTIKIIRVDIAYSFGNSSPLVEPIVFLLKRSTANSSGTSTTETNIPVDSGSAAATAVIKTYTANPTLGSSLGRVMSGVFASPTDNQTAQPYAVNAWTTLYEATLMQQSITLRGTAQGLVVNFNGVKPGGTPVLAFRVIWTEEA